MPNTKIEIRKWKIVLPLFYFLFSLFTFHLPATATTVSGTFRRPDGTPINGTIEFVLSQQAKTTTPPVTYAPVRTTCAVTDGDISPGCIVQGNDTLDPAGTFYRVRVLDLNNIVVVPQVNYTVTGVAVDLSELPVTATDTLVPPSGSVTGNLNVTGNLTVGGSATFAADPQTIGHLSLSGLTTDPANAAAGSVFHRSDLDTIRFRVGGLEVFDGMQYLPLAASALETLDLNASLRIPDKFGATVKRLNHIRFVDPDLWVESGVTAKIDAAITDCFGVDCRVVLPTNLSSGWHTRSTWAETAAVFDLRGDELDPFVSGRYFSPLKLVDRRTTDSAGVLDIYSTIRALHFHDAGGDNATGGPKDTYFTFAGDLYSAGRGQDHSIRGAVFKFGEGDAVAIAGSTDMYGNCLEGGGECAVGFRSQVRQGQAVTTATVSGYDGGTRTISYSGAVQEDKIGVGRWVINTTGAKVYTTGSVTSINTAAPPVVTGSGTGWVTQFGAGAHSDLCFSQNDDDAAGFKFVVPIRSIGSETALTLDFVIQGADKSWPGDDGGSSYRIYKCAKIETINFAGGSFVHASGGATDWAAADTLEVPLGYAWYGGGMNLIVQNPLPSFSAFGLAITNSGSDEPLRRVISMSSGKAELGLVFDNTWECAANGDNCNLAGSTTGIRFQNPPTLGLHYATTVSGANRVVRLNDQFGSATGNSDIYFSTTSECWNFEHSASSANVIQLCPTNGSAAFDIVTVRSTGRVQIGTNPATAGGLRLSNNNSIQARNAANSANIVALNVSASDRVQLAQSGAAVEFVGGVYSDAGGFKHARVSTGSCATSGCSVTVNWSTAFADANYTATCSVVDSTAQSETAGLRLAKIAAVAAGSVSVHLDNLSGSALTGTLHCVAVHD